jgi:ABC-type nitrate/sulfonate/bicarbonate transport system substrate-binding protein
MIDTVRFARLRNGIAFLLIAAAAACWSPARAADKLRVGKAVPSAFSVSVINVGAESGILRKHGIDVEIADFGGDAKMFQAIAAGDLDIGIGGGTDMAFIAKGAPALAVAAVVGPPLDLAIIVPYKSPLKSLDDLKGRTIAISNAGSLTDWLVAELIRRKGWQSKDVTTVALGDFTARLAAIRTGQIDASFATPGIAFQMEEKQEGRLLGTAADYITDFITEAVFATNHLVDAKPDAVRRFIAGWFETVEFMRHDKARTVTIVRKVTGFDEAVQNREYDLLIATFTRNGRFDPKALATLKRSFVPLGLLDKEPDMARLYTETFLP